MELLQGLLPACCVPWTFAVYRLRGSDPRLGCGLAGPDPFGRLGSRAGTIGSSGKYIDLQGALLDRIGWQRPCVFGTVIEV
ncbi:hypothetical protein GQ53DRAFT_748962 [Thozetella sp. PMI_491]|nr:hypothetical protein GQ53DRAFT_748962 [Thozetella sp. PMI_491]